MKRKCEDGIPRISKYTNLRQWFGKKQMPTVMFTETTFIDSFASFVDIVLPSEPSIDRI